MNNIRFMTWEHARKPMQTPQDSPAAAVMRYRQDVIKRLARLFYRQNALSLALDCFKLISDALARCPQSMPSTRNFFFFPPARWWGERLRRAGGIKSISPFDYMLGNIPPQLHVLNLCCTPA